jgi:hypothetical protein
MLCDACNRQPTCLPARLAKQDVTINALLKKLDKCSLKKGDLKGH